MGFFARNMFLVSEMFKQKGKASVGRPCRGRQG